MKIEVPEGEDLYRVDFADGGSEKVSGTGPLDAAKRASRRYNRGKPKHVRVLRAVRA